MFRQFGHFFKNKYVVFLLFDDTAKVMFLNVDQIYNTLHINTFLIFAWFNRQLNLRHFTLPTRDFRFHSRCFTNRNNESRTS